MSQEIYFLADEKYGARSKSTSFLLGKGLTTADFSSKDDKNPPTHAVGGVLCIPLVKKNASFI
ncbi:MAG: hypothetical protein KME46_20630 [Brasilonema angustatum HA4187-MV1]|nr:hypothetical protein [Brasilonema angustatum HA4187-MV1]